MIPFKNFLVEEVDESKLKHLPHVEDHTFSGAHGFAHAHDTLTQTHKLLKGEKSHALVSTKYDGSPSVIFGHHPETGKFFVSSKSVFNKSPKLNYTDKDIEQNHGHAPGLVHKLKAALHHLPKVTPKMGVYQGDIMHSHGDVKETSGKVSFTPNTVTYATHPGSEEAKKAKSAKIGVAVHTAYHGTKMEHMKAEYNADVSHFGHHPDVHHIEPKQEIKKEFYKPEHQKEFEHHMKKAQEHHDKVPSYDHIQGHGEHLERYINNTVRTGEKPSVEGYKTHLKNTGEKEAARVTTEKAKQVKRQNAEAMVNHVTRHNESFHHVLQAHHHLQKAKDVLVNSLSSHPQRFEHSIENKPSKPEGFVVSVKNRPSKLVDRAEFSRANLMKQR